jgi:hypothetical protein
MGKTREPKKQPPAPPQAQSVTLEELARAQGVVPVEDLDAVGTLWPAEDDPERFETFLADARARRRQLQRD